jgi:CRP-like cAMP-binding protein
VTKNDDRVVLSGRRRYIFSAQCPAALNQRQTIAIGQRREKSRIEFPSVLPSGAAMSLIDLLPSDAPLVPAAAGKIIFAQGDPGDVMYVLVDGQVQLMIGAKLVETVQSGGILGEMALIDAGPRSATAIAKTQCVLVPLDEKRFNDLVARRPEFALHVMRILAHRLRRMDSKR